MQQRLTAAVLKLMLQSLKDIVGRPAGELRRTPTRLSLAGKQPLGEREIVRRSWSVQASRTAARKASASITSASGVAVCSGSAARWSRAVSRWATIGAVIALASPSSILPLIACTAVRRRMCDPRSAKLMPSTSSRSPANWTPPRPEPGDGAAMRSRGPSERSSSSALLPAQDLGRPHA